MASAQEKLAESLSVLKDYQDSHGNMIIKGYSALGETHTKRLLQAQPQKRSIVTVHYTGWTIDGKKFDTSIGGTPIAMRLSDLIEGWIIALQQMHVGDQWELYIPAEMGYGKFSQPGIPGGSTLIFDIELIGVA